MVVNQLRKNDTLAKIGGPAYVAMLASSLASAAHIEDHAAVIRDYSMRRDMLRLAHQMNNEAQDMTIKTNLLLDRLEQKFFNISETGLQKTPLAISTLLADALKELEAKKPIGQLLQAYLLAIQRSTVSSLAGKKQSLLSSPHGLVWVKPLLCSLC